MGLVLSMFLDGAVDDFHDYFMEMEVHKNKQLQKSSRMHTQGIWSVNQTLFMKQRPRPRKSKKSLSKCNTAYVNNVPLLTKISGAKERFQNHEPNLSVTSNGHDPYKDFMKNVSKSSRELFLVVDDNGEEVQFEYTKKDDLEKLIPDSSEGDVQKIDCKPCGQQSSGPTTIINGQFQSTKEAEDTIYIDYKFCPLALFKDTYHASEPLGNLLKTLGVELDSEDVGETKNSNTQLSDECIATEERALFFSNLKHLVNKAYGVLNWNGAIINGVQDPKERIQLLDFINYEMESPKLYLDVRDLKDLKAKRTSNTLEISGREGEVTKWIQFAGPGINSVTFGEPYLGILQINLPDCSEQY